MTELATLKHPFDRFKAVQRWQIEGGVLIVGYEMYRILSLAKNTYSEEWKKVMRSALVNPGKVT